MVLSFEMEGLVVALHAVEGLGYIWNKGLGYRQVGIGY